jgi:hypothetical protein
MKIFGESLGCFDRKPMKIKILNIFIIGEEFCRILACFSSDRHCAKCNNVGFTKYHRLILCQEETRNA